MEYCGQILENVVRESEHLHALRKDKLQIGDVVYVKTCNSVYCIRVEEDRAYRVSGGWFDRQGDSPARTTIAGCTWGGSVIKVDVVAAVGLSLEFGNRITTSPIQKIILVRQGQQN